MLTFVNPSNRCWFLAGLHVVIHVPQIANVLRDPIFEKMLYTKRKNCSEFASELSKLSKDYWNSFDFEKTVDVSHLLDVFVKINRNFAGRKMYDATECFLKMIETLESAFVAKESYDPPRDPKDLAAWTEYTKKHASTFLSDVFLGQARQTSKDGSVTYDHFTGLTVSATNNSISKGIQEYVNDPDTGVIRVITKHPLILPVFFQKGPEKHFVQYDTTLQVEDAEYELFSVLLHVNGNHWVALGKSPTGAWNLFDDSTMTTITDMNDLIQKEAMLCLYKKVS